MLDGALLVHCHQVTRNQLVYGRPAVLIRVRVRVVVLGFVVTVRVTAVRVRAGYQISSCAVSSRASMAAALSSAASFSDEAFLNFSISSD